MYSKALTDTHSHIYLKENFSDDETIISNAISNGVKNIFLPNIDKTTISELKQFHNKYPDITYPMIGIHPTHIDNSYADQLTVIEKELSNSNFKWYGIGEIGIDLYHDETYKTQQIEAFRKQLDFAVTHKLPVNIHSRNSLELVLKIMENYAGIIKGGILHCFPGNEDDAIKAVELGLHIGIGGIVTFKKSNLSEVVKKVGLENIVLETDAPYLAPHPYRGKRNESSYISIIAEKISDILGCSVEKVAEVTTKNAFKNLP